MAGAGYKLFNTGDVLTAAQVNTYLQEQTVMVFADAAARTTALSGVLAEGMTSYLKSTDAVEVYNGSAWVSIAADQTPLTTKGDLFTYSTTDTRLAVGSNGETLLADSAASTGLRWGDNLGYAAGKNKLINADFYWNQRNFTSNTSNGAYNFDRWFQRNSDGTVTVTPQTFTAGAAPVSGYESTNFVQFVTSGQTLASAYAILCQRIEDVRTFAGKTVTISFWAKATSGTPKIGLEVVQNFNSGSGGSANVDTPITAVTLSTSWARYTATVTIPSISGKTIAFGNYLELNLWMSAGSNFATRASSIGIQSNTFQFWGVQIEAGSVATTFQTATGTLAGELAACQRYYWTTGTGSTTNNITGLFGFAGTTARADFIIPLPSMRVKPSSITTTNVQVYNVTTAGGPYTAGTWALSDATTNFARLFFTMTSGTLANAAGNILIITLSANDGLIGFNAEL